MSNISSNQTLKKLNLKEFYVAPNGSDLNPGTLKLPFATIDKARNQIREYKQNLKNSMIQDINVYLRGGTYYTDHTILFDEGDSGTNGYKIIYKNYENECPTISGGKEIKNFSLHDSEKNIYKAKIEKGFRFRQLYVDGKKAIRSREPNLIQPDNPYADDNFKTTNYIARTWEENANGTDEVYDPSQRSVTIGVPVDASKIDLLNLKNIDKVEFKLFNDWAMTLMRVHSVKKADNGIQFKMQQEESEIMAVRSWPPFARNYVHITEHENGYYMENAYEFIDADYEWYLDETSKCLYFKAPFGMNMSEVEVIAPQVETLVKLEGTADNPVKNITFEGITFEYSTYMRPSDHGYCEAQAGQYQTKMYAVGSANEAPGMTDKKKVGHPSSAVLINWSENIVFERNIFQKLGATGLDFHIGTHNDIINGNIFRNIAGNGLSIGRFGENLTDENAIWSTDLDVLNSNPNNHQYNSKNLLKDIREVSTNEKITNNYFTNVCTEFNGGCAIAAGYVRDILIAYNEINNVPYTGISMGWGWTHEVNVMKHNIIRNNHVHRSGVLLNDVGAIYTLSHQPNSLIEGNFTNDNVKKYNNNSNCASLYLDQGSKGFTLSNNVRMDGWIQYNSGYPGWSKDWNTEYKNESHDENIIYNAGIQPGYFNINEPSTILPLDKSVTSGEKIRIRNLEDDNLQVWLAPAKTTHFYEGSNMTKTTGNSKYVNAPKKSGIYKIYVQDKTGKISKESEKTITVMPKDD